MINNKNIFKIISIKGALLVSGFCMEPSKVSPSENISVWAAFNGVEQKVDQSHIQSIFDHKIVIMQMYVEQLERMFAVPCRKSGQDIRDLANAIIGIFERKINKLETTKMYLDCGFSENFDAVRKSKMSDLPSEVGVYGRLMRERDVLSDKLTSFLHDKTSNEYKELLQKRQEIEDKAVLYALRKYVKTIRMQEVLEKNYPLLSLNHVNPQDYIHTVHNHVVISKLIGKLKDDISLPKSFLDEYNKNQEKIKEDIMEKGLKDFQTALSLCDDNDSGNLKAVLAGYNFYSTGEKSLLTLYRLSFPKQDKTQEDMMQKGLKAFQEIGFFENGIQFDNLDFLLRIHKANPATQVKECILTAYRRTFPKQDSNQNFNTAASKYFQSLLEEIYAGDDLNVYSYLKNASRKWLTKIASNRLECNSLMESHGLSSLYLKKDFPVTSFNRSKEQVGFDNEQNEQIIWEMINKQFECNFSNEGEGPAKNQIQAIKLFLENHSQSRKSVSNDDKEGYALLQYLSYRCFFHNLRLCLDNKSSLVHETSELEAYHIRTFLKNKAEFWRQEYLNAVQDDLKMLNKENIPHTLF